MLVIWSSGVFQNLKEESIKHQLFISQTYLYIYKYCCDALYSFCLLQLSTAIMHRNILISVYDKFYLLQEQKPY